jgi:hypothetical protein
LKALSRCDCVRCPEGLGWLEVIILTWCSAVEQCMGSVAHKLAVV